MKEIINQINGAALSKSITTNGVEMFAKTSNLSSLRSSEKTAYRPIYTAILN
jgi:hypothetical protein